MKLPAATFTFEFLTDCFSGTAEGKEARESILRVPPIRGHVRAWHAHAFGPASCNEIWGSTAGNGSGSFVAMRLIAPPPPSEHRSDILPHKDRGGSRAALIAGTRASLELTRLPLCDNGQWAKAQAAVRLWLLLGGLGLRSARAAGSVWPVEPSPPADAGAFRAELGRLGLQRTAVALIGEGAGKLATDLRQTASDTVNDRAVFGQSNPRTPSPVRFKVIRLGDGDCLLAHAPDAQCLTNAETLLNNKPSPARWRAMGPWRLLVP